MTREHPARHDGAAARDDAGDALGGEVDVSQADAGVDGEIVDALLALFDERVLEDGPVELVGVAADFLERLVDRDGADGDGAVADDPVTDVVDVATGGEIHDGVGAPADRPDEFLDLFFDRRRDGAVANVGVDLHQEVAADNDGLKFGVVDVGGDDGAAAGDFAADEFGGDEGGDFSAEILAIGAAFEGAFGHGFAADVFAVGDIGHLSGDDAGFGVLVLREAFAGLRALGHVHVLEFGDELVASDVAIVFGLHMATTIGRAVAAGCDPRRADAGQAFVDIDLHGWVGVGAGGVIDADRRLLRGRMQRDLAIGDQHVGEAWRGAVAFMRGRQRAGGDAEGLDAFRVEVLVHGAVSTGAGKVSSMMALASRGRSMKRMGKAAASLSSSRRRTTRSGRLPPTMISPISEPGISRSTAPSGVSAIRRVVVAA